MAFEGEDSFMHLTERLSRIVSLVETHGYVSIPELSGLFAVSEVTIRRDLKRLQAENRLRRTPGGATSLATKMQDEADAAPLSSHPLSASTLDQVDVLVLASGESDPDGMLLDPVIKRNIPIVAEAVQMPGMKTLVSVNNYQGGVDAGRWAGRFAIDYFQGKAYVLDLTYDMHNTQQRSQGFIDGLKEVVPGCEICLSANSQAQFQTAYQLTTDALSIYPHINIIFAINDITARGASQACVDLGIDPAAMLILPYGLEGDTMKDALMARGYCKVGVAMFPEIVGRECIDAAITAYNQDTMAASIETPYALVTPDTLHDYYTRTPQGWRIDREAVRASLGYHFEQEDLPDSIEEIPERVRFVVPFGEHEWYKNVAAAMQVRAAEHGIALEIISTSQTLREELIHRRRAIARAAAQQVQPQDVIILDDGEITAFLAEELLARKDITVITNSLPIFERLRAHNGIELILIGGLFGSTGTTFTGPIAASSFSGLCADKLFLSVEGISLAFGLSHGRLDEVPVKQAMLQSAQQIILLADHTKFRHPAIAHVAPITRAEKLITDNALPASVRLELMKMGIEVILAR
jgi:DeoR/GlpR family transcriptional regulator of sugar metabolism/ABC-type sugar transport system substrate-binding protein